MLHSLHLAEVIFGSERQLQLTGAKDLVFFFTLYLLTVKKNTKKLCYVILHLGHVYRV